MSCAWEPSQFMTKNSLLLAPGNQLTLPGGADFDSAMGLSPFMWVSDRLDMDHWIVGIYLLPGAISITLLAALIPSIVRSGSHASIRLHIIEQTMIGSAKILAPSCLPASVLCGVFWFTAHLYECGDPMMKLTLAYHDM